MTIEQLLSWLNETPKGDHCRTVTIEMKVVKGARVFIDIEEYWIDEADEVVVRGRTTTGKTTVEEALRKLRKPKGRDQ